VAPERSSLKGRRSIEIVDYYARMENRCDSDNQRDHSGRWCPTRGTGEGTRGKSYGSNRRIDNVNPSKPMFAEVYIISHKEV
jgi:hypothetical protein